jgi:hypothetical protein
MRMPAPTASGEAIVFACELSGFEALVGNALVGGFDGRDRRYLHSYAIGDRRAQLLVSHHEQLHHELHWSTTWGVVAAMAGLLAEAGVDGERLAAVAAAANTACRWVHEVFATTISAGVLGIESSRELLAATPRYAGYLEDGLALGGAERWPWQFRESAMQMLLRSLMQPVELLAVAERGFERVRVRDIAPDGLAPDGRLRAVIGEAGGWWTERFSELLREHPDRGGDRGDSRSRQLPDEPEAMERLKEWEEVVLIPALQDVATERLRRHGIGVLDPSEYLEAVNALTESLLRLGPDDWRVEILAERRPLNAEPLGAEREAIFLHRSRARVELIDQEELARRPTEFLAEAPGIGKHVFALYVLRSVAQQQFVGLEQAGSDGPPLLALVGKVSGDGEGRLVTLVVLRPEITPRQLQDMFTSVPLLALTTLSTTREPHLRERVLELERALVLVDLPLRLQVDAWIESAGRVRFRVISFEGERPLTLIVFRLEELANVWFLAFRGEAGYGELAQLLDRHPERLLPGLELAPDVRAAIVAASQQLLSLWHRFDEMGPE